MDDRPAPNLLRDIDTLRDSIQFLRTFVSDAINGRERDERGLRECAGVIIKLPLAEVGELVLRTEKVASTWINDFLVELQLIQGIPRRLLESDADGLAELNYRLRKRMELLYRVLVIGGHYATPASPPGKAMVEDVKTGEQSSLPSAEESLEAFALASATYGSPFVITAFASDQIIGDLIVAITNMLWGARGHCTVGMGAVRLTRPPTITMPTKFNLLAIAPNKFEDSLGRYSELSSMAGSIAFARGMADGTMKPLTTPGHLWTSMIFVQLIGTSAVAKFDQAPFDTYVFNPFTASITLWRQLLDTAAGKRAVQAESQVGTSGTEIPEAIRANDYKLFPQGPLDDRDVAELVVELNTYKNSGKSLNQIAREYTGESKGSDSRAQSLLATVRRMKREGRVNY